MAMLVSLEPLTLIPSVPFGHKKKVFLTMSINSYNHYG